MKSVRPLLALFAVSLAAMLLLVGCASSREDTRPAARQRPISSSPSTAKPKVAIDNRESAAIPVVQAASPVAQEAPDTKEAKGNPEQGKETFEQCSICHNVDNDEAKMGPSLRGLFKKEKLSTGKPASEENIRAVINEGGNGMPGYEELLEADEIENLMAYLRTL
jgi:cytochrome c